MSAITRFGVVANHCITIDAVPEAVLSKKKHKVLYDRWVNPKYPRSAKDERAAIARFWGGWEEGSGLLFDTDVWQRTIHVINPLWPDDKTPLDVTKYRSIDYAPRAGTNVCAWFAVGPRYVVMYRLLYQKGLEIAEFVRKIIEMSYNEQVLIGSEENDVTGDIHKRYQEKQKVEVYWGGTIIDSRSLSQAQKGETLEEIFERYGIPDISAACGQNDDIQIPRMKDWLRIDYTKEHPWNKDEEGKPIMGCPKMFVFDGMCDAFIKEVEGLRKAPLGSVGLMNKKDPSHSIDAGKYFCSANPQYMGDILSSENDDDGMIRRGNEFTGYY